MPSISLESRLLKFLRLHFLVVRIQLVPVNNISLPSGPIDVDLPALIWPTKLS